MRTVIVYESMYGNTHLIADAIATGFGPEDEVMVVPVDKADAALLFTADLVVVGGPTHAHAMSHAGTRKTAVEAAAKPGSDLEVDPDAEGPGLRDWFASMGRNEKPAAAFDTRIDAPPILTGRASKGIARKLHHHGFTLVVDPESFLVTKDSHLEPGEEAHAQKWGRQLAASFIRFTGAPAA